MIQGDCGVDATPHVGCQAVPHQNIAKQAKEVDVDNELSALNTIFTEFYYWVTVVLMFLIHVGFCMYEVGASRYKNHLHTLMKNTILIPLVTVTFFFFGWWIYCSFPNGRWIFEGAGLDLDGDYGANTLALPWDPIMAVNMQDHLMTVSYTHLKLPTKRIV